MQETPSRTDIANTALDLGLSGPQARRIVREHRRNTIFVHGTPAWLHRLIFFVYDPTIYVSVLPLRSVVRWTYILLIGWWLLAIVRGLAWSIAYTKLWVMGPRRFFDGRDL